MDTFIHRSIVSQTAEYALRAVVYLAQQSSGPAAAQQISDATRVPVTYLQKVLRMLAKSGILVAQRGAGGGFTLARLPAAISVLDVLRATHTDVARVERCPMGENGHTQFCALHRMLDAQIARAEKAFADTTIADLVSGSDAGEALCRPLSPNPLKRHRTDP